MFNFGPRDSYSDDDFWNQNPYPDSPNSDTYDIGDTCYQKGDDGDWHRV